MNHPLISVVTPSFNQRRFLRDCLESVTLQNTGEIEHLVIDGGSTDGTVETLREFADIPGHSHLHWISESDRGQSHALNKGFAQASGDFIGWLNTDDRYRPGCFAAVVQAFRDHPEVDVIYGDYTWIDEHGRMIQLRREISFSRFVLLYHRVLYIPTTAMFFRRQILEAGNFLNESLHLAMDYEFFVRLNLRGYRFLHIPALLADFRRQPESKSSRFAECQLREQAEVMRRYSPVLRCCQSKWTSRLMTIALHTAAAIRRYSEKAVRGYYFTQFRPLKLPNAIITPACES